jgi:F-type H+-transporting ATPase subunit gamma
MAVGKEIKTQIGSVKSTQKITRAMQMVAASKVRRAQVQMEAGRPYSETMLGVIRHLANAQAEYEHIYMQNREVRRQSYLVVSTDRGLCGGLNINLFKQVLLNVRESRDLNIDSEVSVIGAKGKAFFASTSLECTAAISGIPDKPVLVELIGGIKVLLDRYTNGVIDRVNLVFNRFVNSMVQKPEIVQLLPLEKTELGQREHIWDYIYEPDAKDLLEGLLVRYIEVLVYQAVVENKACEEAARMIAMKNATDNAGDIIDNLELVYNKARQAAITQEISEIVGGAAAV